MKFGNNVCEGKFSLLSQFSVFSFDTVWAETWIYPLVDTYDKHLSLNHKLNLKTLLHKTKRKHFKEEKVPNKKNIL